MLRSLKELYGDKLGASDGEIGQVKDFYFDDQNWAIRYLVVDTGTWLPGRQVLISPHSLASLAASGQVVQVGLTRRQIENSPSIETQKPVSRQYEEEYYKYYGWPSYWTGGDVWGMSGFPILELPPASPVVEPPVAIGPQPERELHLRSTQSVSGYLVQIGDETIGHICDFMMDAQSWTIGQLVVKTGHRLSGKETLIPTKQVQRISYVDSTVFAYSSAEAAEQSPANDLVPAGIIL